VKIAFVILAYKNPQQLRWMMDALNHPDHHFFLHIDLQQEMAPFMDSLSGFDEEKITMLRRRKSYWGSMECVRVILEAFEMIHQDGHFDYVIHMSGQDFPLLDMSSFRAKLMANPQTSFFYHFDLKNTRWNNGGADRLSALHFFLRGKRKSITSKTKNLIWKFLHFLWRNLVVEGFDKNQRFYGSEFYFIFYRDAIQRILDNKSRFKWLSARLSFTIIPEELYLSTMLMADQSKPSLRIENKTMRTILWDMHHSSPKTLGVEDLSILVSDENWFARKFDFENDTDFHQKLLKLIEEKSVKK
jgi:hypothetical protein